jgi:hypothetical protein
VSGLPAMAQAVAESKVTPGVLGFVVVALLGVATWLLLRSMRRQMGKIDFPEPDEPGEPVDDERPS